MAEEREQQVGTRRDVGIWGAAFLALNGMIGAAIFGLPGKLDAAVGSFAPWLLLIGGLGVMLIALCYADLASRFDASGGPQLYAGAAFGRFVGFQAGWMIYASRAAALAANALVVVKSTVPVGTNTKIHDRLRELTGRVCDVASNPEFLKEGAALDDFMKPDRVVVGVRTPLAHELLQELYSPFLRTERPFLVMSPESAEMTKYVANAMLVLRIKNAGVRRAPVAAE